MKLDDLDGYFSLPCSAWPCGWNDADRAKLEAAISSLIERERADAVKAAIDAAKLAALDIPGADLRWLVDRMTLAECLAMNRIVDDYIKAELAKVVGYSASDQTLTLHRTADTLREVIMSRQFDKIAWIKGAEIK